MRDCISLIIAAILVAAAAAPANCRPSTPTFTENRGQWPDSILFRAEDGPTALWFTTGGVYYQFTRVLGDRHAAGRSALSTDQVARKPEAAELLTVKAALAGANRAATATGVNPTASRCHFFLGDDPSRWRTEVANFAEIRLTEVYPGIDLVYRGIAADPGSPGGAVEYDFRIAAGADYTQIRVRYEGAEGLAIDPEGGLVIKTAWGDLRESRPVAHQEAHGVRRSVEAAFVITGPREFSFRLGAGYDPSQPAVIDPVLVYGTFLGGTDREQGNGVAVDNAGAIYVAGTTYSADFPTAAPYDGTLGGDADLFVTKLAADGSDLVYSTYLGGSGADYGFDLAVTGEGSAAVTGQTYSTDFPTVSAWQTDPDVPDGASADAVIAKLAPAGNSLTFSTYAGGTNAEYAWGIALGADGAAYVTGYTLSDDLPTINAIQTFQGGADAFVVKIPSAGGPALYSTYLGGEGEDWGRGIAADAAGAAYVTGHTRSTAFPTQSPFQGDQPGHDAFAVKIAAAGGSLVYATYLGGSAYDAGMGIAVDGAGFASITGRTYSNNFPTQNAYQANQDTLDAFVVKLTAGGNGLVYGTYLGGNGLDEGWDIALGSDGGAYITGNTYSTNFPQSYAYQGDQGTADAFVTRLSPNGRSALWSTYLGGQMIDLGTDIARDSGGGVYVAGYTYSDDFPTESAYQAARTGIDLFVAKFDAACCTGIRGNAEGDSNDNITVADITFLIAAVFRGGPLPECFEEGDVSGDGELKVGDITYLIAYVFRGGPAPAACP
ncbi:MAG TPA: SBBP repeat-containing protein [candidate division Zixibacteria bacterium]|nr:SBBP repeat-containing protein [candidate division Zixibacteria bacterium]